MVSSTDSPTGDRPDASRHSSTHSTETFRGPLTSLNLPPHTDDLWRYIPPTPLEEPETELDKDMRNKPEADRGRAEVLLSLMMESMNIREGKGLDLPELENAVIAYKMPTNILRRPRGGSEGRGTAERGVVESNDENEGARRKFELKVEGETMTPEAAQAAADKAIAELSSLDFSAEISKAEEAIEVKSKWKGKGKEVATDSEGSGMVHRVTEADADAGAGEEEMDIDKGVEESRRRAREESVGESSSSSKPVVELLDQEEKEEIWAPDLGPAPDLWPAPISAEEAASLDEEDMTGGVFNQSALSLTPDAALALLESLPATSPHYPVAHYILSNAYQQNFRTTGHMPTLKSAIHHAQIAVSLLAPPRGIRTNAVINLCEILNLRYISTNKVSNLSAAIGLLSRTLEVEHYRLRFLVSHFLSRLHGYRYDALRSTDDLKKCIALAEEVVAIQPPLIDMAQLHMDLGKRLSEYGNTDKAIENFELAAALSDGNIDLCAEALGARVDAIFSRNRHDTVTLIAALQSAIETIPASHPMAVRMRRNMEGLLNLEKDDEVSTLQAVVEGGDGDVETLAKLSESLLRRYVRGQDIEDLHRAVEPAEIAMAATECGDEEYVNRTSFLAHLLQVRYSRLGNKAELDRSIEMWELTVDLAEGEMLRMARTNMSQALYLRHKHEAGGTADLDRALMLAKAALDGMGKQDVEYAGRLLNLANCYTGRFRIYGTRGDIDTGISTMKQALEAGADEWSSVDRPGVMGNLGAQLLMRYSAFAESSNLTEAIEWTERSLEETPQRSPHYVERMLNLAAMLDVRGTREDRERAVHLARAALGVIPRGHRIEAGTMAVLAKYVRNLHGDGAEGLNAAVETGEIAAAAAEIGHPDRAHVLGSLAAAYRLRYERLGQVMDLERAVENAYAAVAHCDESTAMKGEYLSELSESLSIRYRRIGASDDADMAVKTARQALDCTPVQHRSRPQRLIELCQRFFERFSASGSEDDLLNAITLGNLCLDKTAEDDHDHSRRLIIVADALHLRHTVYKVFWNDVDRALIMTRNAMTLYRGGPITRPEMMHRMGKLLRSRYRHSRSIGEIDSAIKWLEAAATEVENELPARADILDDLARCYLIRYQALENKGPDGERSFVTFRDVWEMELAPPLTRIRAGARVCGVLEGTKRWSEAADIYEKCVELMPRVTPPSLARTDQQSRLQLLFGIPQRAATSALEAGRGAERALRVLEMGRGIIMGFVINCRGETTDLQDAHPELYEEFNALRRELDSTVGFSAKNGGLAAQLEELGAGSVSARRKRAAEQIEEVLAKIRSLEGFENFLLLPTGAEIRKMAEEGPIVVYSTGRERCDAIIVTADEIKSVRLPRWDIVAVFENAVKPVKDLVRGGMSSYAQRNKRMNTAMKWLWDCVVEPVLAAMGIDGSESVMPQVWWVGSGVLSFAPFHAAGIHTAGSTQNTISRVISSYIPTIKALAYARGVRPPAAPRGSPNVLIVTMPTTPGESDLNGAQQEASNISEIVGANSTTTLTCPSASEVLDQLASHSVLHFACHGISDPLNPSASALLLQSHDGTQDRLTVQAVSEANTTTAQVAYLSACSTAENLVIQLADEGIHLAMAFMLAGFRNVVGTLWAGSDDACVEVAAKFYAGLFVDGVGSGVAMHKAIVKLRDRKPGKVLMWAPFIHTGA